MTNTKVLRPSRLDPDALHLVLQQLARLRVQRAERLVAEQHVGIARERPGERGALAHARRQLVRLRVRERARDDVLEPRHRAFAPFGRSATPTSLQRELHVARRPRAREQRGLLEEHGPVGAGARDRPPVERAPARGGLVQAGEHVEDRRLAAPDGPSRHTNSPTCTSNVTSSTAVTVPPRSSTRRVFTRSRTASFGAAGAVAGLAAQSSRRHRSDPGGPHRSRNFSAISICTTLPSWITSTTVP